MNRTRHVVTAVGFLCALSVGGCATAANPGTSSTSASGGSAAPATPAKLRVIRVTIHGQNVSPAPDNIEIPLGTTVRLVVTSDHDDELHAHGFEVERTLKAGTPTTLDLTATDPGVYEVETHHPPLTLMHLVIR